jgi:hypothetical protein
MLISVALGFSYQQSFALSIAREWNEKLLSAIRINLPNPPAHARNLFHTAVVMYDAWAAYDATAVGYVINEKISPLPSDIETARREAISYAAYRILRNRFASGAGSATTLAALDAHMTGLGYSPAIGQAATTSSTTPAELGKRIGQALITWSSVDGFTSTSYLAATPPSAVGSTRLPDQRGSSIAFVGP